MLTTRTSRRRSLCLLGLISIASRLAAQSPTASEALSQSVAHYPPAASESELQRLLALDQELGALAEHGTIACPPETSADDGEGDAAAQVAAIARQVESNATLAPLLKKHGFTGKRWLEVTFQLGGAGFALYAADENDADARRNGRPAIQREQLLRDHASARFFVAHSSEFEATRERLEAACPVDDESSEDEALEEP